MTQFESGVSAELGAILVFEDGIASYNSSGVTASSGVVLDATDADQDFNYDGYAATTGSVLLASDSYANNITRIGYNVSMNATMLADTTAVDG